MRGENKNACRIFRGKLERKKPLGRPRHRWVDNIEMGLREMVWGVIDRFDLTQNRDQWRAVVNVVLNQ
jgi:hypothetical protein